MRASSPHGGHMQYALRTNIHLATWREFLPELIRFCHEAHIDEVLLSEES